MLPSTIPTTIDVLRLLSAVGDTFGGQTIGFGLHVANVAARFCEHRGCDREAIASVYYAAALHAVGAIGVTVIRDAGERDREIAAWDAPLFGAAIAGGLQILPPGTADAIRWHREAFDGTGFPDRLRWNGIPETAMTVNIVRSFVAALESQAQLGGRAADAVFTLVEASGSVFALEAMREFRAFLAARPDTFDAPYEPQWDLPAGDARALIANVCTWIDARDDRTARRGDRLERIVRAIAAHVGDPAIDPDEAAFAGRLTAFARLTRDGSADNVFTLSRLGLESRGAQAADAAHVLAATAGFAPYAEIVGSIEEWFDGTGAPAGLAGMAIDPYARLLAVALAAEAVTAGDAARRIQAAAGTRLDPTFVAAYLSVEVKR